MNKATEGGKQRPCACVGLLGALVIVFAWWEVSWGPVALTAIGALILLRGLVNRCCCPEAGRPAAPGPGG